VKTRRRPEPEAHVDARHLIALRAAPEFANLDADVIAALAQVLEEKLYPRGTALARAGAPVGSASLVLEGRVRVDRPRSAAIEHGAIGIVELLSGDPAGLDAVAETDVRALTAPADALLDLLEEDFGFLSGALEGLARGTLDLLRRTPSQGLFGPPAQPVPVRSDGPLHLAEKILALHAVLYFAQSRVEAVAEIARVSAEARFAPGAPLWRRGDEARGFLLVVRGDVDCRGDFGQVRAGAGQPLGGLETIAGRPHWYEATAATPVLALLTERDAVLDVLEDQTDMGVDMVRFLAARQLVLRDGAART
jgi:CRP-like cAMP-binding protein